MGIEQRRHRCGDSVVETVRGGEPTRRSLLRLLALTVGVSPLISLVGCSVLEGGSTPTVAGTPTRGMPTVKRSVNGLDLEVPAAWKEQVRTSGATGTASVGSSVGPTGSGDPWVLTMVDPGGDDAPILAVSSPLPAKARGQVSEVAVSLLSSSFPDYRTTGSFSLTERTNSTSPSEGTGLPAATAAGTSGESATSVVTEVPSSSGAGATTGVDSITRLAFSYRRSYEMMQARAWVVPTQGYVVVTLLKPDDMVARVLETSMLEAAS